MPALESATVRVEYHPMRKRELKLEVIWEQEPGPDAEERLLKAFEMLLTESVPKRTAQEDVENHFDSGALTNNHD